MAKKDKGFKDIGKGLRKNPALLIGIIVAVIIVFVIISNSQNNSNPSATDNGSGLPNGTGGSAYYIGLGGGDYATGGPWDSFFRQYPGSYHSHHHHTHGKSGHGHTHGHGGSHGHSGHGHGSSHGHSGHGHKTISRRGK